jgi:hypothetical protein
METRFGYNANPNAYQACTLMEGVKNNYKLAVEAGTWLPNLAKNESNEIAALQAEIEAMKAVSGKETRDNRTDRNKAEKYAWKKVAPSEGDPKTKQFEEQTYHWCSKHKMWTMHKESECKGVSYRFNNNNTNTGTATPTPPAVNPQAMTTNIVANDQNSPNLRVAEAMETIVEYTNDYGY